MAPTCSHEQVNCTCITSDFRHRSNEHVVSAKSCACELIAKTLTEYHPEKVRGLNKAYIDTIKQVIKQGNLFLDKTDNFELGLKIAITIENYQAFLSTLPDKNETE